MNGLTPTQERLYEFARAQFMALKHIHTEAHIQGMLIPTCQRREYDLQSTHIAGGTICLQKTADRPTRSRSGGG